MFDAIPTMLEQIRGGQVRALATTGPQRDPLLPEVPTVAETLPGFDAPIWIGLMAPAGTPPDIVERVNAAVNQVMGLPETEAFEAKLGAKPMPMSVAEFDAFLRKDIETQREWITKADIKIS